jgi:hypothetical protein
VIVVQVFVMCGLLAVVAFPLFRNQDEAVDTSTAPSRPFPRLRPVPEEEIIAEFLRSEFYHPDFDPYRQDFKHLVDMPISSILMKIPFGEHCCSGGEGVCGVNCLPVRSGGRLN